LVPAQIEHFEAPVQCQSLKDVFHAFGGDVIPVEIQLVEMAFIDEELFEAECEMVAQKVSTQVQNF
jgi:hypothetical protein